jgi:hypothetical protein
VRIPKWLIVSILVPALLPAAAPLGRAQTPTDPILPPLPPPPPPVDETERAKEKDDDEEGRETKAPYGDFIPDSDKEWGLPDDLREKLASRAVDYATYALRFVCDETVRTADYNASGEATKEKTKLFEYILSRDADGTGVEESRSKIRRGGQTKPVDSDADEIGFPPAFGWTLLFSSFNQPYFAYRDLGDGFEGFDWVRAIEFKGSLPWTNGKDIREWEGIAIVNAADMTLLEVRAQPSGQAERIRAEYERWNKSFSILGARTKPKPMGYRCRVALRMRKDGLTFPTQLRYDTFRAVSQKDVLMTEASIREYENYRFYGVEVDERVEGTNPP